jgi:hypothetical protein
MNSIRAISINTLNDDRSKSLSSLNTSWKIEKYTDNYGKLNYKIKTDKVKNKTKIINHTSLPAYGVPGSKSYQTKNVPTLNQSIIKNSPVIKTIKNSKKSSSVSATISQSVPSTVSSIKHSKLTIGDYYPTERSAYDTIQTVESSNYLVYQGKFLSYKDEKDLIEKSYLASHLFLKNASLHYISFIIHSSVKFDSLRLSFWTQKINQLSEVVNIYNHIVDNYEIQNQKIIIKNVNLFIPTHSQFFVTCHFESPYNGDFGIKYSLFYNFQNNYEKINELNMDIPLSIVENVSPINLQSSLNKESSVESAESDEIVPEIITENIPTPIETDLPSLSNTIFGSKMNLKSNIPIFNKPKEKSILNDSSNFSLLQTPSNIFNKKDGKPFNILNDVDDSSNNSENDLRNILEILKELKQ